ncbi:thioredoxin family protein [Mariniflexile gromovii]|uniref:Thioredoxin family protein n=1 Tax=Mariniflexile gromovii TaxID=362523 RepID=A0ABS4BW18_9FLAO|nr:thioredoxin family protein [Mariniflexile gromovii]MBP0904787.1 thioredoxin family protein [Mariniflexile gromovii]
MDSIIKNSLKNGLTYQAYRDLVKQLSEENTTTGIEKTEAFATYTKLNDRRMNRWDKTLKVSNKAQKQISEFETKMTWLVIAESWCGDAAHVLPVLNKMAELNHHIDLKIVLRDENPELMDAFLTNGSRSIPKLIIIDDESGHVLNTYGPRPSEATSLVNRYKVKYGVLTPEFKEDLQHWYNNDKGQNIIDDVTNILCELQPTVCQ